MKVFLFILLLFLGSCSSTKSKSPLIGVPSELEITEKSDSVIIEDQEYGPTSEDLGVEKDKKSIGRRPVIGMIFGPGINRTVGYSVFLKSLKRKNISANIVSGTGMGAVIAAHYASGKTPQKIEWLFFKFFNETRGKKPYSRMWKKSLEKIFLLEFENTRVQDLKIPLVIPVFHKKTGSIINHNRGNLFKLLQAQFIFQGEDKFTSPLEIQNFNAHWLKKLGADLVVGVDALGSNLLFDEDNDLLKKHYEKILKVINREKKFLDLYIRLPFDEMPLDSEKKLPESLQKTNEYSRRVVNLIQDEINLFVEKKE